MRQATLEKEPGTSAITLLERQHRRVSMLLGEIAGLDRPSKARADLCKAIAGALTAHLILEERHVGAAIGSARCASVARAARHRVESLLADLARLGASVLPCVALLASIRARTEAYFAEHQDHVLRALRGTRSDDELVAIGAAMLATMREIELGSSRGLYAVAGVDRAPVRAVARRIPAAPASRRRAATARIAA